MAMQQRDKYIDELNRIDALLQFALMHGDEVEAARLRARLLELSGLGEKHIGECRPVWDGKN